MLIEIFCQKLVVSNVILTFLDYLKPNIFLVGQPWWPTWSATSFQNLWIYPWAIFCYLYHFFLYLPDTSFEILRGHGRYLIWGEVHYVTVYFITLCQETFSLQHLNKVLFRLNFCSFSLDNLLRGWSFFESLCGFTLITVTSIFNLLETKVY